MEQEAKQVFISYHVKDRSKAIKIRDFLERNGIPCWFAPRDIRAGASYPGQIAAGIRACPVFVLLLSENARESRDIRSELAWANEAKKSIFPLLLEEVRLKEEFDQQLRNHPVINMSGSGAEQDLLDAIRAALKIKSDAADTGSAQEEEPMQTPVSAAVPEAEPPAHTGAVKEMILCPKCGCDSLKDSVSMKDAFLSSAPLWGAVLCDLLTILAIGAFFLFLIQNLPAWEAEFGSIAFVDDGVPAILIMLPRIYPLFLIPLAPVIGSKLIDALIVPAIDSVLEKKRRNRALAFRESRTLRCCACDHRFRFAAAARDETVYEIKNHVKAVKPEISLMILKFFGFEHKQ